MKQGNRVAVVTINWDEIEKSMLAGMDFATASERFGVKEDTIRKRAKRFKWATPLAIMRRAAELSKTSSSTLETAATDWISKGETHRAMVFEKTTASIKKFKPKAPKNFRELEAADKVARRAAGLDVSDVSVQTLIQLHENMENFDQEEPIEIAATVTVTPLP